MFVIVARLFLPIRETTRERGKEESKEVIKQKQKKNKTIMLLLIIRKEEGNANAGTRLIYDL